MANGYSYESTRRELLNEYQHDRVLMVFANFCVFVLWTKAVSALEGLIIASQVKTEVNLPNMASGVLELCWSLTDDGTAFLECPLAKPAFPESGYI